MPSFREVQYYLAGLWLLICRDVRGFRFLDITDRGLSRSFWAILWCLPPTGISWLWWRRAFLRSMPADVDVGSLFYFRLGLIELSNWVIPFIFAGFILLFFRLEDRFSPIVVTMNWLGVPLAYINGLLLALLFFLPDLAGLISILMLVFTIGQVFIVARMMRMIFKGQGLMAGAMTLSLLVPSLILSEYLQRFLDVYPA